MTRFSLVVRAPGYTASVFEELDAGTFSGVRLPIVTTSGYATIARQLPGFSSSGGLVMAMSTNPGNYYYCNVCQMGATRTASFVAISSATGTLVPKNGAGGARSCSPTRASSTRHRFA